VRRRPVADGIGADTTLVIAGLARGVLELAVPFALPGIREPSEGSGTLGEPLGEGPEP